jgi:hypothetical protein
MIKNLQIVTVHLVKWDHFDFLEFMVFYQTNRHHINF